MSDNCSFNKILNFNTSEEENFVQNSCNFPKHCILGKGAYGIVIKAVYKNKKVAVKIFKNVSIQNKFSLACEKNAIGLIHENLIKTLKVKLTKNYGLVVMKRTPGEDLQTVLDNFKIPLLHRIFISSDICNGLNYCHQNNVIHFDIKPSNILVTYTRNLQEHSSTLKENKFIRLYRCKICDFGSSHKTDQNIGNYNRGTVRFMAPELFVTKISSPKIDIYSFGITMWHLKTGVFPYLNLQQEVIVYNIVKNKMRPDTWLNTNKAQILAEVEKIPRKMFRCKNCGSKQCIQYNSYDLVQTFSMSLTFIKKKESLKETKNLQLKNLNQINTPKNCKLKSVTPFVSKAFEKKNTTNNMEKSKLSLSNNAAESTSANSNKNINPILNASPKNKISNSLQIPTQSAVSPISPCPTSHFKNIFNTPLENSKTLEEIENDYILLYKKCWSQSISERPLTSEIKTSLNNMLEKYFSEF